MILLLISLCLGSDTVGVDSATYDAFNGYQYVYSTNTPSLYTDTWLLDDDGVVIGHVPTPTPIGTYGPAARVVVCYNSDVANVAAEGRMPAGYGEADIQPEPVQESTTTTTRAAMPVVRPTVQHSRPRNTRVERWGQLAYELGPGLWAM